jgi:hypothetical protein
MEEDYTKAEHTEVEKPKKRGGRRPGVRLASTPLTQMRNMMNRDDFPKRPKAFIAKMRTMRDTEFLRFLCNIMLSDKPIEELAEEYSTSIGPVVNFYRKTADHYVPALEMANASLRPVETSAIRQSEDRALKTPDAPHPVCEYLFGPGQDAPRALAQCEELLMSLDVFKNFQRLLTLQNKRLRSLLIRQSQGERIREKDITDVINSMRSIVLDIAKLQVDLDIIQTYGERLKLTVQNTMINFNDTMDMETRKGIGDLSKFMVGFFQKEAQAAVAAKENAPDVIEGEIIDPS